MTAVDIRTQVLIALLTAPATNPLVAELLNTSATLADESLEARLMAVVDRLADRVQTSLPTS